MALGFFYNLQNIWPLSIFKYDDVKVSNDLVKKLPIPESTKAFVFAVRDPESESIIYILAAQNLSQRSALDAECLIKAVRPEAVMAQVTHSATLEIQAEENELTNGIDNSVPTSAFQVLKRCFVEKINKDRYENVAGNLVLKEIFGVGFYGHVLAAKSAAKEVGSSFVFLESSSVKVLAADSSPSEVDAGNKVQSLANNLIPQKMVSASRSTSRRLSLSDDVQLLAVKLLASHIDASAPKFISSSFVPAEESKETNLGSCFQVPSFAQSIYPLLVDLHNIFSELPSISRALALSQKMLYDVNRGEPLDRRIISEVYSFRIAVEGLRIALNYAGRLPIRKFQKLEKVEFSELPVEDKSHALLAQALQSQSRKFKTVVAVVDAGALAGLRKNWKIVVPPEVKDLVGQLVTNSETEGEVLDHKDTKGLFSSNSMLALGAGATAVLGASSLAKFGPASTIMKVGTFKLPASLKLLLAQTQRIITLGQALGPSKVVAPGLANSGANAASVFKAAASAEKIRTVAHSIIASVEKTSFSAMRTAFYEIMRKRQVQPVGFLPWVAFGCSIATCSGLLVYGDGIECAAESLPSAPSIANLGRGIQNLHQVSKEVTQTDGTRIQKGIELLTFRLKSARIQ